VTTASLIVSFYNDAQALGLVLSALGDQTCPPTEVVIADDGSTRAARDAMQGAIDSSTLDVKHVWQEDRGFRKTRILNEAVRTARSEYLIFLDGDCIPQRHFVEDHLAHARPHTCLSGRRACLSESASLRLRHSKAPARFVSRNGWRLALEYIRRRGRNIEKGFRITQPLLRRALGTRPHKLTGCNFSLHRQDLLAINGFDERYEQPGIGEDGDLDWRLRRAGMTIEPVVFLATQLHLHHAKLISSGNNKALFAAVMAADSAWTPFGIERRPAP